MESAVDWALSNPDPYSQPSNLKEESKIASNSGSTSIRGSSGDTILKCNKLTHIGKEISIEEERIRLEAAKSEEHERLIEQEKRKLKQPEMTTKIKTLEQIKAEKLALEKKKQSERVERMLKLKEREQKDILDAEKRRLDRLSKESHLRDIPSALKLLKNSHGQSKFREVLKFITKILENVIRYPENPKYRSISTESTAFKTIISEHIGATSILRILGFQDVPKSHKLQLINLNLDFLSEELKKMQSVLDYNRTNISKIFAEEISSSVDDKLLSVIALEELFENVLINISSLFTRTIPKDGDLFTGILGRVPASISVLEFAGFIDKQFSYVLEEVDGSFLSSILEDLRTFRKNHVDETNIYKQLLNAKEKNEPEKVCKAVQLLIVAIENVVKDPHSTKYHKCLLKKILVSIHIFFLSNCKLICFHYLGNNVLWRYSTAFCTGNESGKGRFSCLCSLSTSIYPRNTILPKNTENL